MMKKKILLTGAMCLTITALVACSEKNDSTLYESLEKQVKHNVTNIAKDQLEANLTLQAAISGKEKELVVKVLSNANIMNKPSRESNIVGTVKAQESVLVIGNDNVGGWYKVAYNGRVCYVEGVKLDIDKAVADNSGNDVNSGDNNRPTSTTKPQRPVNTTGNNNNNNNTDEDDSNNNSNNSNNNDSSDSGSSGNEPSSDEENTTIGNGDIGNDDEKPSNGEEDTTPGNDNPSEGDGGNEGESSEENTTPDDSEENTTPPNEDPEETTTPGETLPPGGSEEEETTPPWSDEEL